MPPRLAPSHDQRQPDPLEPVNWRLVVTDCASGRMTEERLFLVLKTHPFTTSYIMGQVRRLGPGRDGSTYKIGAKKWFAAIGRDLQGEDERAKKKAEEMLFVLHHHEDVMRLAKNSGIIEPCRIEEGTAYMVSPKGVMLASILTGYLGEMFRTAATVIEPETSEDDAREALAEDGAELTLGDEWHSAADVCIETGMLMWDAMHDVSELLKVLAGRPMGSPYTMEGWPPKTSGHYH